MNRILGVVATLGFTASLAVHLFSYAGYAITETLPGTWLLHLGVFVVWIPVLVILNGARRADEGLNYLLESIPVWVILVVLIGGQLIFVSGMAAMLAEPGVPKESGGRYFLVNKGTVLREISEEKFHHLEVLDDRSTSAVWMLFYGFAAIVFLFVAPMIEAERERSSLPAP